ncbi:MAG: helix-turn-helix domain-containing protein [Methanoregula sp.]|nr:helix-turn-helix domain-containing protein [Methanoregula sp.]
MKSGLRNQLAEKMAGEITLSDSPGHALKKWRMNFEIAPGILADRLGVSPSVISDYESGRRKSPGTAVVGKIVDTLLAMDEENEGKHIQKYSTMLFSNVEDDVIYDIHEYAAAIPLKDFSDAIGCTLLCGSVDQVLFGYTVVNSLNAIMQFSSDEFNRIYGWSTERAVVFTNVSTGKSPMVAIRVTPFKPRCVVLQGLDVGDVHPIVEKMAERDRITVMCTMMDIDKIVSTLREKEW